jgi:hypothetical protein
VTRKILSLFLGIVAMAAFAVGGTAQPAQAASGCTNLHIICFYDNPNDLSPLAIVSDSLPRNQCTRIAGYTSFIGQNTGVQWFAFHTGDCSGAHTTVFPYTDKNLACCYTAWEQLDLFVLPHAARPRRPPPAVAVPDCLVDRPARTFRDGPSRRGARS